MKNEEIIKELEEVIDCIANEELKTAIRMALTIIEKLQPKPTMIDDIELLEKKIFRGHGDKDIYHAWMRLRVELRRTKDEPEEKYKCKICGGEINKGEFDTFELCDGCWDKPEEKVYGPQKCNETVKTCENCAHGTQMCSGSYCHNFSEWEPILTNGKQWKEVNKEVE